MESTRVLIAYESRLARQLVRTIVSRYEDFEVIGEIEDESGILPAIEQNPADFLIVEQEESGQPPAICERVLARWPHMRILAVASGSEKSTLYWVSMEIRSVPVETCEEGVINALRGKIGSC